ncbi:MAG: bifunctional folylpolyglutamate synthase/dihydrofolate synthase [Proteobacteria bacterium]|nr:bifunctional folylpolyglutamate synthase/dihydrofolate synthase [Pseudomonadota bacterium]MBU1419183.1 bifunctional folylpolyglutamate synthase/dihydrofolate synthase [Pseudomonadota bacterium]
MNYQQAWDYLDSLQFHKIKLGLEAMRSFMARVDNPEKRLNYVHVAGTNGKGSVSVTLLTILSRAGYRVGLYTSPHLSSVRERFRINDTFVSEEKFAELATRIHEVLGEEKITYFEFTTALAFLWFAEEDLDLVVLETGLGGRLDATNIVNPLVSVITNVSMDHEAYLGNTLSAVAGEKAGIIKPGVAVVSAVKEGEGLAQVQDVCREKEAPLFLYGKDFRSLVSHNGSWSWHGDASFSGAAYQGLRCSMKGEYQIGNASLALAAIELLKKKGFILSEEDIRQGLAEVRWPGRLEHFCLDRKSRARGAAAGTMGTIRYLLDGAHNPAGVDSLVQTLQEEYTFGRLLVIWGAMVDKDLQKTLPPVAELADLIFLTKPVGERSAEPELLLENVPIRIQPRCRLCPTVAEAIAEAETLATEDDLILIAGSLYLVGASRKILLGELVR